MLFFWYERYVSPRYIGPYEIIERIETHYYQLELPQYFSGIHNVFHMSMLCKYESNRSHVIQGDDIELDPA